MNSDKTQIDSERRYCLCQKSEDELNNEDNNEDFMIECDGCNGWFHGRCVSLADRVADDIEKYFCTECSKQHGPSIFKKQQNQHRRDYSDANAENKPIQTGTKDFIKNLKRKTFLSCEPVIVRLKGEQITKDYMNKNGFTKPILIANRDGLDIVLPSRTITLQEINDLIGPDYHIDVIDCEKQVSYKMSFQEYAEYFESYDRSKIYNVLSLEVSPTKLGESVTIPRIVRDLSWATTGIWPEKKADDSDQMNSTTEKRRSNSLTEESDGDDDEDLKKNHFENFARPEVAKYCLLSPQASYTDFHVDFGGSSVWYSVVRGEKIFYLIEPTDENLQKYADWTKSPTESETFLGDCVSHCYKLHLREGNTVLLPPGWIHAVYTVTDSLVFGGNFLQSMGIDMQLRIYELEQLAQVPVKFKYPLFETYHWYAAKAFHEKLRECNRMNSCAMVDPTVVKASEAVLIYMNRWLTLDKRYQKRNRYIVPRGINCEKLLRGLSREVDRVKTRCAASTLNKIEAKELIQIRENKMKVKCHRPSSDSENAKVKEVKLIIKTKCSRDRTETKNDDLLPSIKKKKLDQTSSAIKSEQKKINPYHGNASRLPYKLDPDAKRKLHIKNSHMPNDNDTNTSSTAGKSPEDDIESRDSCSTSFVKRSILDNDIAIKQESQAPKHKILTLKKSKVELNHPEKSLTKKLSTSSKNLNRPQIVSNSQPKATLAHNKTLSLSKLRLENAVQTTDNIKTHSGVST